MHKAGPLHVPAHLHLDAHAAPGKQDDRQRLHPDHHAVEQREPGQPGGIPRFDEFVDGIPLEQRQRDIHDCHQQVQGDHRPDQPPVGFQKRQQLFPGADIKGFCVFLFIKPHGSRLLPPRTADPGPRRSSAGRRFPGTGPGAPSVPRGCRSRPPGRPAAPGCSPPASGW